MLQLEYTALREVLLDGNIKLHILMNHNFIIEKQKLAKIFYGIDGKKAFTKKDSKVLVGDVDLKKQARLPKSIMGYCAPLALETNGNKKLNFPYCSIRTNSIFIFSLLLSGTIFTALKLETSKKNAAKKFVTVFTKRVAQYAGPSSCQKCECSRYDSGKSYMDCHPCEYPSPASFDLVSTSN